MNLIAFYLCCIVFGAISSVFGEIEGFNILIHSDFGSRSHVKYLFEITKPLSARGHKITYVALQENAHFTKGYNVSLIELPGYPKYSQDLLEANDDILQSPYSLDPMPRISIFYREVFTKLYQLVYPTLGKVLDEVKPDLLICDMCAYSCQDLALEKDIPLIIGTQIVESVGLISSGALTNSMNTDPTKTNQLSFPQKFYDTVLLPLKTIYYYAPVVSEMNNVRETLGVPPVHNGLGRYSEALVLADTFFGFLPPIEISPNLQLIGPILTEQEEFLSQELLDFLELKSRVIYVSFGSEIRLPEFDLEKILAALFEGLELGILDGVVWGLGRTSLNDFPQKISKIDTQTLLNKYHSKLKFISWVPQRAVLEHISTRVFLTHSGMASLHEAMAAAIPTLNYPIIADQPRNARKMKDAGLGLYVDRYNSNSSHILNTINELMLDLDGNFSANIARIRTLASIDSFEAQQRHKAHSAHLIETFVKTAKACRPKLGAGCELIHRLPVTFTMSFISITRLDIFVPLIFLIMMFIFSLYTFLFSVYNRLFFISQAPKEFILVSNKSN